MHGQQNIKKLHAFFLTWQQIDKKFPNPKNGFLVFTRMSQTRYKCKWFFK